VVRLLLRQRGGATAVAALDEEALPEREQWNEEDGELVRLLEDVLRRIDAAVVADEVHREEFG